LKERNKEHSIKLNYGSLYSVVEALRQRQLIAAVETRKEGNRPARTIYEITESGDIELHEWLRELLSTPVKEYPALEAGLSLLPVLPPDMAATLLAQRVSVLTTALTELSCTDRELDEMGFPRLFRIENDYHEAMLRAERDFISDLAEQIRSGVLGGVTMWRRMHELTDAGHSFAEISANPAKYFGEEEARWLAQADAESAE
ncbi:MAG: PadR family transcriptional regulator, partial [Sciscionella sp.]